VSKKGKSMNSVRTMLLERGAALVGFADLAPLDEATRRGFPRAVAVGMALTPGIVAGITTGPTEAYLGQYRRTNNLLTELAQAAAQALSAAGWRAEARPATGDWDTETLRAPFSHKMAATLAGLGWIGKCDLLITREFGAAVRWATVLTDAPLSVGVPVTESRCGACRACVEVCPGHACSGRNWRQGMTREELWDPRACMAGMKAVNARLGVSVGICGMCVAACPWTRRYLGA
jgi:epoxyqueuosine reductase